MKQRNNDVAFFRQFAKNMQVMINVAALGRVVKLNGDKSRADVQPLAHNSSGSKRALLLNLPVSRHLRKKIRIIGDLPIDPIKVGDTVLVVFLDRSTENWGGGSGDFTLGSERMHDVNDAVVVEVI